MNTFIIMWSPDAPGLNYERFKEWFYDPLDANIQVALTDWKRARVGDRFFMVRADDKGRGGKGNGIVMSGFIISEPFVPDVKFTDGKKKHYVDVQPDYMFDTNRVKTLTDDFLTEHLPEFDWKHGPSGKVLDKAVASRLEELWEQCLQANSESLQNGLKWRTAQDVFRRIPFIQLYQLHHGEDAYGVVAEIARGGLYVTRYEAPFYDLDIDNVPDIPGSEPFSSVKNFSIELHSLKQAFKVRDDKDVVKRIRKDFMGATGMKRLREYAQEAYCLWYEE